MQEFCSVCLDSTEDNTDKEGDAVNYMFNQFIDEEDGYYWPLEIIQSDHSLVLNQWQDWRFTWKKKHTFKDIETYPTNCEICK